MGAPTAARADELRQAKRYAEAEAVCRQCLTGADSEELRWTLQRLRDGGYQTDQAADAAVRDPAAALQYKAAGDAAHRDGCFDEAHRCYTVALGYDHSPVVFSNRSATSAELEEWEPSRQDAASAIAMSSIALAPGKKMPPPTAATLFSRSALAQFELGMYEEANQSVKRGLQHDPKCPRLAALNGLVEPAAQAPPEVQQHLHKLREEERTKVRTRALGKSVPTLDVKGLQPDAVMSEAQLLELARTLGQPGVRRIPGQERGEHGEPGEVANDEQMDAFVRGIDEFVKEKF